MKKNIFIIIISLLSFLGHSEQIISVETVSEQIIPDEALKFIYVGNLEGLSKLIEEKNLDLKKIGTSLLINAIMVGKKPIIEFLLKKGVNINAENEFGLLPLMYSQNAEIMKFLLEHGAKPNLKDQRGQTILMYSQTPEIAKLLLEHGAIPNIRNKSGQTAYDSFIERARGADNQYMEIANVIKEFPQYLKYIDKLLKTTNSMLINTPQENWDKILKEYNQKKLTFEEWKQKKDLDKLRTTTMLTLQKQGRLPREVAQKILKEIESQHFQ